MIVTRKIKKGTKNIIYGFIIIVNLLTDTLNRNNTSYGWYLIIRTLHQPTAKTETSAVSVEIKLRLI